jgi:hypothetical protein
MGFKLPPLSSVRVFEAAARHGSFKNAAEELNITASAVSDAVQNLEDWLGVELFRRGGGKLELSCAGRRLCGGGRQGHQGDRRRDGTIARTPRPGPADAEQRTRLRRALADAQTVPLHGSASGDCRRHSDVA